MGSFSIWHWLIVLLFAGAIYAIYRSAKRAPANTESVGPSGVGGWLLLLVTGLMFLGPLMGAGRINSDIMSAESQYPNLTAAATWGTYKAATWWTFLVVSCLSFYTGIGLARGRDISVVYRAKIMLWIIGPVANVILGLFIPVFVFGKIESGPEFIGGLTGSAIAAAIWTAYLTKSKRVKATYGISSSQEDG